MSKRSYHQFCPVAYSLDILGERWTLLLVRDLMFGPRRYSDLLRGLPGMGTNLLAQRLKELEESGVIRTHVLPPPAASTAYELTPYGRSLEPVILALTRWGLRLLRPDTFQDDYFGVASLMTAWQVLFDAQAAASTLVVECHSGSEVFHAAAAGGALRIAHGEAPAPALVIRGAPKELLRLSTGAITPVQAVEDGLITLDSGDRAALERFAALFRFPEMD